MKGLESSGAENRLARETSPYLLQHRTNPVDWYPGGDEAFAEAQRRDVPVFLSIGYSTCYWCHVMERESFESQEIAKILNEHFVSVKVDREERPDIDDVYMAAVQAFAGRGGWPMSLFLEPRSRKPFFAGTYFPPEPRYAGVPSFPGILTNIAKAWRTQRDDVLQQSEDLAQAVIEQTSRRLVPVRLDAGTIEAAVTALLKQHDRVHGGFGSAGSAQRGPKFPQPVFLDLLLEVRRFLAGDVLAAVDAALTKTLDAMALGGVFDHLAGGFHRYSVDEKWTVPHFEKMLYDNALLADTYARASIALQNPFWARVSRATLDYALREMLAPEGVFFSAQDAEVDHREGLNYLWTADAMRSALVGHSEEDIAWVLEHFDLINGPNFRDPHHPEDKPANVLRLIKLPDVSDFARLESLRTTLLAARAKRKQPATDDKVLVAWNGLMIAALASASPILKEPRYLAAAERAATFILRTLREKPATDSEGFGSGGLLRSYRAGAARIDAYLEDYAFFIQGLLRLHTASRDAIGNAPAETPWLAAAKELTALALEKFSDETDGSFYDTPAASPDLFVRTRSAYDGALPSGSGAMIHNLVDLTELTGNREHAGRAAQALHALSGFIEQAPSGAVNSVRALLRMLERHRDALNNAFEEAAPPDRPAASPDPASPVEVFADRDAVTVKADQPAAINLRLRIAEGMHINAADPAPGADARFVHLVPLRVGLTGGSGVAVYADYPPGEPYGVSSEIRVHRGTLEFPVVVERAGDWSGNPILTVQYQACTDTECLPPTTVELDLRIDRE